MEIIDKGEARGDAPVQIAFAETRQEAALIRGLLREEGIRSIAKQAALQGPSLGTGLLTQSSRRIYVHPAAAARARELLGEVMVEDPYESEIPEPANAEYLADAKGRRPRNYNIATAYTRIFAVALVVFAIVFALFLLLH